MQTAKMMTPIEYTYHLQYAVGNSSLLTSLGQHTKLSDGNIERTTSTALFNTGRHNILDIDVYAINAVKQGYMFLYFKSREDAEELEQKLFKMIIAKQAAVPYPIYKFGMHGYQQQGNYSPKQTSDLVGCNGYIERIMLDIVEHDKYKDYLNGIGENHRSLNYLMHGPPGCGKTSTIKAIATTLKLPIYIVNGGSLNITADVLTPPGGINSRVVVILKILIDI